MADEQDPVEEGSSSVSVQPRLVDADACLKPASLGEDGIAPFAESMRNALKTTGTAPIVALTVGPSFAAQWMLSLHRRVGGQYFLRVTKLDRDAWAAMVKKMSERQGSTSDLSADRQAEALAELQVKTTTTERVVDLRTANLLIGLWTALTRRAQVVHEVGFAGQMIDGVEYQFWHGQTGGSTQSPSSISILGKASFAAEWLARLVEAPSAADDDALSVIRNDMQEALLRTRQNESCLRPPSE